MKKITQALRHSWLLMAMMCLASFGAIAVTGCAGKTNTSTVTTEVTGGSANGGSVSSVTTQKEVETSAHPRGVIGGTFYVIGQILIWPFKVIGSLFS